LKIIRALFFFLFAVSFLQSCEKKPVQSSAGSGKLQIHFSPAILKSDVLTERNPRYHVILSISDSTGSQVLSGLVVDMIRVGNEYYSLPVELPAKNYVLNECIIFTDSLIALGVIPRAPSPNPGLNQTSTLIKIHQNQVFTIPAGWFEKLTQTEPSTLKNHPISSLKKENWVPIEIKPQFFNHQTDTYDPVSVNLSVFQHGKLIRKLNIERGQGLNFMFVPDKSAVLTLQVIKDRFQKFDKTVSWQEMKPKNSKPLELNLKTLFQPTNSLIARFPFNNNTETTGKFIFKAINNGAVLTTDRFGEKNAAFAFNGKGFLDYGDILNDHFLPVTISVWVRVKGQRENIAGMIFQTDSPNIMGAVYAGISLGHLNNTFSGGIGDGNGGGSQYRRSLSTDSRPYFGKWVHIVYTLKSSVNQKYYLDGKEVASFASGTGFEMSHNQYPLQIGNGFIGDIDDISFFDYELSTKEIDSLYRAESQHSTIFSK